MNIFFIGDVVGSCGRRCVSRWLDEIKKGHEIDFVVANGENAAGGLGVTPKIMDELFAKGIDAITLGNHTFRKKELASVLDSYKNVVRPANYAAGVPGKGAALVQNSEGKTLGLLNVQGRVFMDPLECPFVAARDALAELRRQAKVVIVDFHAEATSEKVAMGWFLDGQCTAVVGTHTHVQTADERVLPKGTAYITDVGMTGPMDSVIGVERDIIIKKFLTGMPAQFKASGEGPGLNGVVISADDESGKALSITRVVKTED